MSHCELEEIAAYIRDLISDGYNPTMEVVMTNGMTFNVDENSTGNFSEDEKPYCLSMWNCDSIEFISIDNILYIKVVEDSTNDVTNK